MPFCHLELKAKKPCAVAFTAEPKTLGEHLRKRRVELGLLQKDMAPLVGADLKTVSNWELNRAEPELRFLPAILAFLGFDPRPEGQTLGERLRRARTSKGISHRELARLLMVDESTIWKWEAGRHRPTGRLLARLREVMPEVDTR